LKVEGSIAHMLSRKPWTVSVPRRAAAQAPLLNVHRVVPRADGSQWIAADVVPSEKKKNLIGGIIMPAAYVSERRCEDPPVR
jgi:hypothetical protein